jgi:2-keto-4-pentenoate hydratase/2-oxohepta-3-ene-1,7-dioic acid hydratase in catechol pathway
MEYKVTSASHPPNNRETPMKLLTFAINGGAHVGAVVPEGIVDLTAALNATNPELHAAGSLLSIIQSGIDIDDIGDASLGQLRSAGTLARYLVRDPKFLPPVLQPPKILALALNYQEHIDETNLAFYNEPIVFEKYASNLVAHEGEIELPPFPQKVDEEHELALVVGRDCRHIRPHQAADYIFGYTICNDVSARDRQRERLKMGQPYSYAKNFATFCPMGPWVVTKKELGDPRNLNMKVRINGKVTREGNSKQMIFNPFEVLAYCSDYTPMQAGDIISLGTFAGDKAIHAGDVVELEVERIGTLRNRVVASKAPWANFAAGQPTGPLVKEKR